MPYDAKQARLCSQMQKNESNPLRNIAGWKRQGVLPLLLAVLYVLISLSDHYFLSNRRVSMELRCEDGSYVLTINGRSHQTESDSPPSDTNKIGFYVWHRGEPEAKQTFFRNLEIESLDTAGRNLQLSLTGEQQLSLLQQPNCATSSGLVSGDAQWEIAEGEGLHSRAGPPGASFVFVGGFEAADFVMRADIANPYDAGFVFHADDQCNGEVIAVRPPYNDAIFFSIRSGMANPIQHIVEYSTLQTGRELLRLVCLICWIIFWAGVLWQINLLLRAFFRQRTTRFDAPAAAQAFRAKLPMAMLIFVVAFSVFAFIASAGFNRIPHITDEAAYLFQARIYAEGHLWAPPPPVAGFFDHYHLMIEGQRWFSKYPPLFSLVLALGVLSGWPWLINPLLGAMLAGTLYLIAQRLFTFRIALIASIFFIASPLHMFMSATMMAHTLTALCLWQMIYHALAGMQNGNPARFAAAGAFWAAAFMTRPFTAAVVLLPVGIGAAVHWRRSLTNRASGRMLAAAAAGAYPLLVLFLCWSVLYSSESGQPMIPYVSYHSSDSLGFGADKGAGWLMTWGSWGHTPAKALRSISIFLENTMQYLHGWPLGMSLVFVPLAFWGKANSRRPMIFLLGVFLSLVAGHAFYWATEHLGYGARYWYAGMPGITLLSAVGLDALIRPSAKPGRESLCGPSAFFPILTAGVFMYWNAFVYLPLKFFEAHTYGGISSCLGNQVAAAGLTNAIIFVKTENSLYNDGFHLNDPFLRKGPYFVNDLGPRNDELMRLYPNYQSFQWDKKSLVPVESAPAGP